MPTSKKPTRKGGSSTLAADTARRLTNTPQFNRQSTAARRGSVGRKGGRPPRFPGRTGGR